VLLSVRDRERWVSLDVLRKVGKGQMFGNMRDERKRLGRERNLGCVAVYVETVSSL
jgi:hypothetical protein